MISNTSNSSNDGTSVTLDSIIAANKVSPLILEILQHALLEAIASRHPDGAAAHGTLSAAAIILDSNLSIAITPADTREVSVADDIRAYGEILLSALSTHHGGKRLTHIAQACATGSVHSFPELALMLEKRISNSIYIPLIIAILGLIALLACLNNI